MQIWWYKGEDLKDFQIVIIFIMPVNFIFNYRQNFHRANAPVCSNNKYILKDLFTHTREVTVTVLWFSDYLRPMFTFSLLCLRWPDFLLFVKWKTYWVSSKIFPACIYITVQNSKFAYSPIAIWGVISIFQFVMSQCT